MSRLLALPCRLSLAAQLHRTAVVRTQWPKDHQILRYYVLKVIGDLSHKIFLAEIRAEHICRREVAMPAQLDLNCLPILGEL